MDSTTTKDSEPAAKKKERHGGSHLFFALVIQGIMAVFGEDLLGRPPVPIPHAWALPCAIVLVPLLTFLFVDAVRSRMEMLGTFLWAAVFGILTYFVSIAYSPQLAIALIIVSYALGQAFLTILSFLDRLKKRLDALKPPA